MTIKGKNFRIRSATYPASQPSLQLVFFRQNHFFYLTSTGCAKSRRYYREESNSTVRRRILASGNGPIPASILSSRWRGLSVAGMTHVTVGWAMIHFITYCEQM